MYKPCEYYDSRGRRDGEQDDRRAERDIEQSLPEDYYGGDCEKGNKLSGACGVWSKCLSGERGVHDGPVEMLLFVASEERRAQVLLYRMTSPALEAVLRKLSLTLVDAFA